VLQQTDAYIHNRITHLALPNADLFVVESIITFFILTQPRNHEIGLSDKLLEAHDALSVGIDKHEWHAVSPVAVFWLTAPMTKPLRLN
jgi:hypothetical protein